MHLGVLLKNILPLSIYLGGLLSSMIALGGNTQWALLIITFLLPLRNFVEKVQDYPGGTQFVDVLIFSSIIGWFVKSGNKGKPLFEKSSLNIISVVLIFYLFISVLIGSNYLFGTIAIDIHDQRVQDWKNFCLLPVMFYTILNNTQTKKQVWQLVGVMCAAMALMDYYTINQIHEYSSLISREKISATFQFLGPNEVAAFFNEYTIILISLFYVMKWDWKKILLAVLILLNLFCIIFTYSRGAYIGMGIGFFILFLCRDQKMLIPLILVALLWQVVLPQKAVERIKDTTNQYGQLDESSQGRIAIWHQAMELFKENPVAGIGYGVFRHLGFFLGDTHNIYVKILTEQGVIGLIIFLIILFCFMKEGFVLYQKGEEDLDRGLGLGLFMCIFVLIFNNFFGDRWSYLEPNAYLWIFGGLVARLNAMAENPEETQSPSEEKKEQKNKMNIRVHTDDIAVNPNKKVRFYDL